MSQVVVVDTLRSLAFGSISGTYAAVGTQLAHPAKLICITNATDGDMFFSFDGSNNQLFLKSGTYKLFDLCTNRTSNQLDYVLPIGAQLYVKQSTAPSSGAVYLEVLYAKGQ